MIKAEIGQPTQPVKVLDSFYDAYIEDPDISSSNVLVMDNKPELWDELTQADASSLFSIKGFQLQWTSTDRGASTVGFRINAQYRNADGSGIHENREVSDLLKKIRQSVACDYFGFDINLTIPVKVGSKYLARVRSETDFQPTCSGTIPDTGRHYVYFLGFTDIFI